MIGRPAITGVDGQPLRSFTDDPYSHYARLREQEPVYYDEYLHGWLLTQYGDVRNALRDERLSADRMPDIRGEVSAHKRFLDIRHSMLMFLDPPRHTEIRRAVAGAMRFDLQEVSELVAAKAEALLHAASERPQVDLIAELAQPLPIQVLGARFGVPAEDDARISHWASIFNLALGRSVPPSSVAGAETAAAEFEAHIAHLLADGRLEEGILRNLHQAVQQGILGQNEMLASSLMLVSAGRETITDFIGTAIYHLSQNPIAEASARQNPDSIPGILDELLRIDSPVQLTRRVAKAPLAIGGRSIEPGERVIPVLAAANHDPAVFADPARMMAREDGGRMQLAFGAARHRCPGANLARVEAAVAIRSILERIAPLELCQPPTWKQNPTFRGLNQLVVRNQPRGAPPSREAIADR